MQKAYAYLQLMRPANQLTAISDIWAGAAIAGCFAPEQWSAAMMGKVGWLSLAAFCLYGGGVVFNDVFDAGLDRVERPERAIPSGRVSLGSAVILGLVLLALGMAAALQVGLQSGVLGFAIVLAALTYDKWGKHYTLAGPLNMGLCRGLDLLLGMSMLPFLHIGLWGIAAVPVVYIAAVTMISRGEVHGGSRATLYGAALLYVLVLLALLFFAFHREELLIALPFLLAFGVMIFVPLTGAVREPAGPRIGKAVKAGVLALILMNASWVAASGSLPAALLTVLLLPLSLWVARLFAVT
ncbi:UbiA-like protein EboC [Compostibacter hankyongensis]|uniref:UbiA family prenyltransferase n=1 Tax=Compostibacter hankyongensis TaxID=1007089 RepID=A0ABP8FIF7_9BACT